ncbi:mitochondrial carrier domain containing protein [Naviculisporaceae sp. PSN 640]
MQTMSDNNRTQVLLAGAVAAFTVDILIYPLDTIKTRYQSQDFRDSFAKSATTKGKQDPSRLFRGLYQGIGSVIFATLPAAGLFFITYESVKSNLQSGLPSSIPKPFIHATASCTAELASCIVLAPAEIIKQNAQMLQRSSGSSGKWATSVEALRTIRHGPSGMLGNLWSGYMVLVARNLPYTAINFPLFEFCRAHIWAWQGQQYGGRGQTAEEVDTHPEAQKSLPNAQSQKQDLEKREGRKPGILETGLVNGTSASLSSAVAALATTPADVIKTRIMISAGDQSTPEGRRTLSGSRKGKATALGVARAVVRENGLSGLFRGGSLRASWAAIGGGLYLGSYEAAKVSLGRADKDSRPDQGF